MWGQAIPEIIIPVDNGSFVIRGLKVSKMGGAVVVESGDLFNQTSADWDAVDLKLHVFDAQGVRLPLGTFVGADVIKTYNVRRDRPRELRTAIYGQLKEDIARVDVTFVTGEYPATYAFAMVKPSTSGTLEHSDQFVEIAFSVPGNRQVAFTLRNKTDEPIEIPWDRVSFVGPDGTASKVVHQGVRYADSEKSHPPSVIPPGAKLEDFVYPADLVSWSGKEWRTPALFPDAPRAAIYKGRTFSVFLPMVVNGATKNYNFAFVIEDVR